ncbi:MAG: CshA/CshB family fibrillar adhesin-related protein [Niabella sp.]
MNTNKSFKTLILLSYLLFLLYPLTGVSQNLFKATGGNGQYRNDIYWLDFTGVSLAAGQTVTKTYTSGDITITFIIDNVSFTGQIYATNINDLSVCRLVGYRPGSWSGDGIDNLYNIGGANTANTLRNALAANYQGYGGYGGQALNSKFRVRAYATLLGQPMNLGLVFSSAEDDGNLEYTQGTTNGSPWQLVESALQTPLGGYNQITFSNSNLTAKMQMGSLNGGGSTPANVALLYTLKQLTTAAAPLQADLEFNGMGRSAQAIGFFVRSDFGDAPISYGAAQNVFFPVISGGSENPPASGGTVYLTPSGARGGTPLITAGTFTDPEGLSLGLLAGDNDLAYFNSATALGDNTDNTNDEDAFATAPPSILMAQSSYTLTVPVLKKYTTIPASTPGYVMAWYDFNRNGIFEPSEYATASFTANNTPTTVTLNWDLTSVTKSIGSTFIRFRITSTNPATLTDNTATTADERSFISLALGETEDYPLFVSALLVNYDKIEAVTKNGQLQVNWNTLSEKNSDKFEIQGSVDGANWKTIGTVYSKAAGGESDNIINYEFTTSSASLAIGGSLLFALLFAPAFGFRKYKGLLGIVTFIVIVLSACSKKATDTIVDTKSTFKYIRIAQHEKDGTINYSKSIRIINE